MDKFNEIKIKRLLRFFSLLSPYRNKWVLIFILSGLSAGLSLINPYLTKFIVDEAIGSKDLRILVILLLIVGSVFIGGSLIDILKEFLGKYINRRVYFDLNKKVFRHIQDFPFLWFVDRSTGEHIYKISYDINRVTSFVTITPTQAISLFPRLLFSLIIVFYLNWKMAILAFLLTPFLYLPPYYFSRKLSRIFKTLFENSQGMFSSLAEVFSHIQLIKACGKESSTIRNYLKRLIVNMKIEKKQTRLEVFSDCTTDIINKLIIGIIALYGGYQVIKSRMSLGSLTAIMVYFGQLMGLQGQFAYFFQNTIRGIVSGQRIAQILDERTTLIEAENAKKVVFKQGEVVFKNVGFGYREGEYILKNISFDIKGGRHIAVAGPSGCGKSTLLNLILRLYDPLNGGIFIDGENIKELSFKSLRGQIGMALQDPFLFNDTIKSNIAYGIEGASDKEILEAARLCGIDAFVEGLALKYETVIGENACKISEGQKQRIAIARALIKKPKILIMDEAMSSLDSEREEEILSKIKQIQGISTLIVVSHRLSTLMAMDRVYYLADNETVVADNAQNLLKNNTSFSKLFASQVSGCDLKIC
ncbi:MAG: ABC transporter ATP-binding protein/permease [Candidatus Omnitrophica bacterium]|nr:ABC transporter ATP-binding protein/permease [Candidatus Omnitrophota bacterium]MBU1925748.1 ABC transporter ATP-binding protein/permease [Candidatus Omnitrophota bacterium]